MPVIPLHNVPLDILLIILGYVDPISLINLAQTCQALRATIRPTRANLLQRLLALELIPEYGGIVPFIRSRTIQVSPPMGSKDWQSNKYACGGCLKLLPHTRFDNHNILRLDLRKPPPGSKEANRLADWWYLDGWDNAVRARIIQYRIYTRVRDELELLAYVQRQHYEATHLREEIPHSTVADRIASDAELLICGLRRYNRRCIECCFLRGDWVRSDRCPFHPYQVNRKQGVSPLPLATGRKMDFYNLFDRCFPNLFRPVPRAETGRRFYQLGNQPNKAYPSIMRIIRCGGCAKWYEAAWFRLSIDAYKDVYNLVREIDPRDSRCNRCFLREHGLVAFRRHLIAFARSLMLDALDRARFQVLYGWEQLRDDFRLPFGDFANYWAEYGRSIISDFPIQGENLFTGPFPTIHQLDELSRRYTLFKIFIKRIYQGLRPVRQTILDSRSNEEVMSTVMRSWFRIWYEDYHLYDRTYRRLLDRLKWIEEHEEEVVSYALEVDPWGPESYDLEAEVEEER